MDDILDFVDELFERHKEDKKDIKTYPSARKGVKQCDKCKQYVAARCEFCACGEKFQKREKTVTTGNKEISNPEEIPDDLKRYIIGLGLENRRLITIYTPAGECPISFSDYTFESVCDFCESVIDLGIRNSPAKLYMPEAIKYWARTICDKIEVFEFIDKWVRNIKQYEN